MVAQDVGPVTSKLAMTVEERQRWETIRGRGETFFVLFRGLLVCGGAMFIFNIFAAVVIFHLILRFSILALAFIVFGLAGILFGLLIWRVQESRYWSSKSALD